MVLVCRYSGCDSSNCALFKKEIRRWNMTLLEMITKWERVKDSLKGKPGVSVVNEVLEDLRSTIKQPSWSGTRHKILGMIDKAITNDDPDGAHTWARVLEILPE